MLVNKLAIAKKDKKVLHEIYFALVTQFQSNPRHIRDLNKASQEK